MPERKRMIVWADAEQESLVREAVEYAGLDLIAAGSPSSTSAARLCEALNTDRIDDLRQAIQRDDLDLLWLAAPQSLDAAERRLIREVGLCALSTEPRPVNISEAISDPAEADTADFVPLMRRSAGYRASSQVLEDFGPAECVNVFLRSGRGEGTLFARLFDAMDVIEALCGEPETLDAALASPLPGVPDSLAGLHGHVTVNLRFTGNRCACVAVSDLAGAWFRGVTILGENGCLRINDTGFDWIARDGQIVETQHDAKPLRAGQLVGEQIRRTLESLDTTDAPPDNAKLLALCESARLSCRTGQGETPRKVMEMMSRT